MKYTRLNKNWNAEPNAPEVELTLGENGIELSFFLNSFIYQHINSGDQGKLEFKNVHKFRLGATNDEGYYSGQFRYSDKELPWGDFYELHESNWKNDFPNDGKELKNIELIKEPRHFIFFFRDETFECIAERFELSGISNG